MGIFYNIGIWIYYAAMKVATLWNQKAVRWVSGRRQLFELLRSRQGNKGGETVWMHCASLGEFEQGRPVLEKLKSTRPDLRIVLTFFSPSGYEVMKDYTGADIIDFNRIIK
jgi:3-deoxy-D-manno-octulosonic-acid transferase